MNEIIVGILQFSAPPIFNNLHPYASSDICFFSRGFHVIVELLSVTGALPPTIPQPLTSQPHLFFMANICLACYIVTMICSRSPDPM